jgi:CspA family cold shock protein
MSKRDEGLPTERPAYESKYAEKKRRQALEEKSVVKQTDLREVELPAPAPGRLRGRVKWFDQSKGFGFVTSDQGAEIFIHFSDIQKDGFRTLNPDEYVEFEIYHSTRGPQAKKLTIISRWK